MTTQPVTCAACGATLKIEDGIDHLTCAYCDTVQIVRRGDGYIALQIADKLTQAISDMGERTESTIRSESDETQAELRQLQLRQDLSTAQMQLTAIHAEIRALEREGRSNRHAAHLRHLRKQEEALTQRIAQLSAGLQGGPDASGTIPPLGTSGPLPGNKNQMVALLLAIFFGVFGAHRFYTGHILIGIVQLITVGGFGLWLLFDLVMIGLGRFTDAQGQRLYSNNPRLAQGCLSGALTYGTIFFLCGNMARILESSTDVAGNAMNAGALVTAAGMLALILGVLVTMGVANSERLFALFRSRPKSNG